MKFNKKLLHVLLVAAVFPSLIFRIIEWRKGLFETKFDFFESLLFNTIYSIIVTLSIALVILNILKWLNKKFPWNENLLKRLFSEIVITFPIAILLGYLFGNILFYVNKYHNQNYSDFVFSFLIIATVMNFVLVAISDWFYFFERWKLSLVENEKEKTKNVLLEKENLSAQLGVLKKQMNPHFLFNSLNVLSSLVHNDPVKAEDFIDEFSDFYRSILDQNENDFVPLNKEIETCKSYMFLQEIRFEKSVKCSFSLNTKIEHFFTFPLAVQTLLENAIKHNALSKENPLNIEVNLVDDKLQIKNNLQKRTGNITSTGMGHKNLIKRYSHFNKTPVFQKTSSSFICYLPLLKKEDLQQFYAKTKY